MSLHVEYANPERITFINELDLVEANNLDFDGSDTDVLCIWYDELVVIPVKDAEGARAFAWRILDVVDAAQENGRALRVPESDV